MSAKGRELFDRLLPGRLTGELAYRVPQERDLADRRRRADRPGGEREGELEGLETPLRLVDVRVGLVADDRVGKRDAAAAVVCVEVADDHDRAARRNSV